MTETPATQNQDQDQDFAQVTVQTPFSGNALASFLADPERLLRINSQMEYEHWRQTGDGEHEFKALNLSIDKPVETAFRSQVTDDGLVIRYASGLKTSTTFRISAKSDGLAELIITDDYSGTSADQRRARMDEVDKSLVQWGRDIHRYLHLWKKWSWVPGWKWYMVRVWHGMKPSARRISSMIMMIGLAEFVMFAMVFVVFWLELDNFLN